MNRSIVSDGVRRDRKSRFKSRLFCLQVQRLLFWKSRWVEVFLPKHTNLLSCPASQIQRLEILEIHCPGRRTDNDRCERPGMLYAIGTHVRSAGGHNIAIEC
jgi:hypothetical protein